MGKDLELRRKEKKEPTWILIAILISCMSWANYLTSLGLWEIYAKHMTYKHSINGNSAYFLISKTGILMPLKEGMGYEKNPKSATG